MRWPQSFMCICVYSSSQFFSDCVSVCLSDCSLESCFSAPWVMGSWETNGCRTDCLLSDQRNAAGVNRTISFLPCWALFSSFLQNFLSKCFRLVIILVIPFVELKTEHLTEPIEPWVQCQAHLHCSCEHWVMIIVAHYFLFAPHSFVRAKYKERLSQEGKWHL